MFSKLKEAFSKKDFKSVKTEIEKIGADKAAQIAATEGTIHIFEYIVRIKPSVVTQEYEESEYGRSKLTIAHVAAIYVHIDIVLYVAEKNPSLLLKKEALVTAYSMKLLHSITWVCRYTENIYRKKRHPTYG